MKFLNNIFLIFTIFLIFSCSKTEKVSTVKEKNIETQMIEAFEEGYEELENGDVSSILNNDYSNCLGELYYSIT